MSAPGADTICNLCSKAIRSNHNCIACTSCQYWQHFACNNLTRKKVDHIKKESFVCIQCKDLNEEGNCRKRKKMESTGEVDNTEVTDNDINEEVEVESEGEFEEFEGYANHSDSLTEFELARHENIKRNQEMFEQLNIMQAKNDVSVASKRRRNTVDVGGLHVERNVLREKKPWENLPPRKSLRIQNIKAEEPHLASFRYQAAPLFKPSDYDIRKPAEMDMKCVNDLEEGKFEATVKTWLDDNDIKIKPENVDLKCAEGIERYNRYKKFDITVVTKLTKSRAYCVAWHPSKTKRLLCQGDKKGSIGVWDMNCGNDKNAVFLFDVHAARPISCLTFDPFDPTKIYSSCYDGTLTCGDFNQMKFLQKFAYDEDDRTFINHFAWPKGKRNTILCATTAGEMVTLDLLSGKAAQTFTLRRKKAMRCIDCHPLNEHLIACSHNDGTLAMWDWRMLSNNKKNCLSSFTAGKTIVKTYFSPQTGNKLLMTSQDDYVRVLDVDPSGMIEIRHPIKHKNYYGRFVTTFRSTWDPKTDNVFTCASMKQPRCVDLFGCDEEKHKLMTGTLYSENLTSISSINVFHPHLDLLASVNSSGKVYIWSLPTV